MDSKESLSVGGGKIQTTIDVTNFEKRSFIGWILGVNSITFLISAFYGFPCGLLSVTLVAGPVWVVLLSHNLSQEPCLL